MFLRGTCISYCPRRLGQTLPHFVDAIPSKLFDFTFHCHLSNRSLLRTSVIRFTHRSIARRKALQCLKEPFSCLLLGIGGLGSSSLLLLRSKYAFCQDNERSKQNRVQAFRDSQLITENGTQSRFHWQLFFSFLKPDILFLLGAIFCSICLALVNTEIPILLGKLVDVITKAAPQNPSEYFGLVKEPVTRLCFVYIAHAGLTFLNIVFMVSAGERLAARLRTALFQNLLHQDIAFFDTHKTGELISRLSVDVQDFKSNFKNCFITGFRTVVQTIGCAVSLYTISPNMASALLFGLPCMFSIGSWLGATLRSHSRRAQAQVAHATDVADEALGHIRTVRGFAAETTESNLYREEIEKSRRFNDQLGLGIGVFQSLQNLAFNAAILAVIFWGGSYMADNKMQPGDLMSFMVTSQTLQKSLASLSMLFGQTVNGMTAGARVFEPTMLISGGLTIPYHSLRGQVTFKGVNFCYPSRPDHAVLKGLDLVLPAGQVIALCGTSGSGKSTVAALLERFYDPDTGQIFLDDKDIKSLDPSWLRGRVIGYISQEPTLFATSIIENIRYGRQDATDQEVYEAAKTANVDDFVSQFPEGYRTVLGERGVTVSGGQKQRIAIARALLKNPSILILDEATSALDSESEKFVQEALDKAAKGRTVLVIAHRLSTIQNANSIALIVNGRIAEFGDHKTLIRLEGQYWQFVQHQSKSETNTARASG